MSEWRGARGGLSGSGVGKGAAPLPRHAGRRVRRTRLAPPGGSQLVSRQPVSRARRRQLLRRRYHSFCCLSSSGVGAGRWSTVDVWLGGADCRALAAAPSLVVRRDMFVLLN